MNQINWPLAASSWGEEEPAALIEQIKTNRLTMGPAVSQMEETFASWNGSSYAVMVNSGSSANLLMIAALRYTRQQDLFLQPGDQVIVPAVSWSTTYFPLTQYGLEPVFVDVDPATFNLDVDLVAGAVTEKTRAVLAVNLLGNPCHFDELKNFCHERDLLLLEDNCESLGCTLAGVKGGCHGLMGSHSSYFSHHFSTMEGGYVTTDDEELYQIMLSIRSHGWTRHLPQDNLVSGRKSDSDFDESFKFVLPGYNLRPLELSAVAGLCQMEKIDGFLKVRRANARLFAHEICRVPWLRLQSQHGESSWFGFGLVVEDNAPISRDKLMEILPKMGVDVRPVITGNFTRQPVLKHMNYSISGQLHAADTLHDQGFFIGNHHFPLTGEIDELVKFLGGL